MINYFFGDLINSKDNFDFIAHGCNCFHNMSGGIASTISCNFPNTLLADIQNSIQGDSTKLGNYTYDIEDKILNLYTQYYPGRDVSYDAIKNVFKRLNIAFKNKHIAIPLIGCGIAGGDWQIVSRIIYDVCPDINITVFLYPPEFKNKKMFYLNKDIYEDGHKIFFQGQLVQGIVDDKHYEHFSLVKFFV